MSLSQDLLSKAFNSDSDISESAREEIVALNDIDAFYECINRARELKDVENLEFWLLEVVTSRRSAEVIAKSLIELSSEILQPQRRFNEALFYLRYLQKSVFGALHKDVISKIEELERELEVSHSIQDIDGWRNYDLSKPLQEGLDQQHYYNRFVAYFHATNDSKTSEMVKDFETDFLPKIIGFFIGLTDSLKRFGVERDTAVKAYIDFLKSAYPEFRPGLLKVGGASAATSTPPALAKEEKSTTTNQKGYGISKN